MEGKMRVQISLLIFQTYNGNWLSLTCFTVLVRGQEHPVRGLYKFYITYLDQSHL